MAGFYVHIPFCRQACRYCDFHFSVSLKYIPEILEAMLKEIELKKEKFQEYDFQTLYFGGGTPSVLSSPQVEKLRDTILHHFNFIADFEFTIEANPDDLTTSYLKQLKSAGINRLSIGIQSFHDKDLILMRRSHDSSQAIRAIENSREIGIHNINADLIYGIPGLTLAEWEINLDQMLSLDIPHLSAYHLSFESGTVFDHWRKKGRIFEMEEKDSLRQFKMLIEKTREAGYIHYEISNFAKEGFISKHNTLYWKQIPYVGIGPSAHSFDGNLRFWNISNNKRYIKSLMNNEGNYCESEELSLDDKFNEYILTRLRTTWGIDKDEILQRFGDNYVKYTEEITEEQKNKNFLAEKGNIITLTEKGIFLSDQVIREFFRV